MNSAQTNANCGLLLLLCLLVLDAAGHRGPGQEFKERKGWKRESKQFVDEVEALEVALCLLQLLQTKEIKQQQMRMKEEEANEPSLFPCLVSAS